MKSIYGLGGMEEALALRSLAAEQDDDGCNVEEEKDFNEDDALDDARQGAGYESEEARF